MERRYRVVVAKPGLDGHDRGAKVIEQLKEKGADDVLIFGGGIIPDADIPKLKEMGAAAIFTPGSSMVSITDWLRQALEGRE